MNPLPIPQTLTTKDVANLLQVTEETVLTYVRRTDNPLPAFKTGRVYRFHPAEVQRWLESVRVQTYSLPLAAGE